MNEKEIDIFVPGRVCLFGEHSDWAGVYRRINSKIVPGNVIISGTNQGIYAKSKAHQDQLKIESRLFGTDEVHVLNIPMDKEQLKREAESDSIFCYAAGVAYYMLEFYNVGGIEINNYSTTLPVKKGLSSSAAFCVLVARSFNKLYNLGLTKRAEIEAAYQGEIMTSSRCGRMDQGCAYGQVPVQMVFDGELMTTAPLASGGDFHLLIGDLNREKDTVKILADLNRAFPFPRDDNDQKAHHYLGDLNQDIIGKAIRAIENGDARALGGLMNHAQQQFDDHLMAFSSELKSPRLHRVLADENLAQWVYGGKGVGSQGDGCVQFVTRGRKERSELAEYLEKTYDIECFELDLNRKSPVRKAVIPVAGNGTRMFPATKAVKKCFLPVITEEGVAKPVIQLIIEEALSGGVQKIGLIIHPDDEPLFNDLFAPLDPEAERKLPKHLRSEAKKLAEIGRRISLIHQEEQAGLGHAVSCAEKWIGDEPFMLLLGDHVYKQTGELSCAAQVVGSFEQLGSKTSVIGVYEEQLQHVEHYGTVSGSWEKERILALSNISEKPTADYADEYLAVKDGGGKHFYCVNGIYILMPTLFPFLAEQEKNANLQGGELQLTTVLAEMITKEGAYGCHVDGEHYDTGLPSMFAETVSALAKT